MKATKVICAEPNEMLRKVLTDRLEKEKFEVISVEDGNALVDAIEKEHADIVISEELLPFKNGFEIIEVAKKHNTPIIIISDADLEEKILEAFELGASDFIDKPFSPNEVVARIKNILIHKTVG